MSDNSLVYSLDQQLVTSTGSLGIGTVSNESRIRFVITNAGGGNTVRVRARINNDPTWTTLIDFVGNTNETVDVFTWDQIEVIVLVYSSLSNYISVIASSFDGIEFSAIAPDFGDEITNVATLTFTSSDNSVIITGDSGTGTIDFQAVGGGGGGVSSVNGETGVVILDAADIPYDNTSSGSPATDVQGALDTVIGDENATNTALSAHITETTDAHDASAISNIPLGNLSATDVQAALNELQASIDSMPDPMEYKGLYNATTNSPVLSDGIGNNGDVYYVNVAGTQNFGSGPITFAVSDKVVYNGASGLWEKWDTTESVSSVFGRLGAVIAVSGDYTASQITNVPSGNLAAIQVQAALNELQSDIDTRALDSEVIKHDGSVDFTADQSMGGNNLTNLSNPISAQDAATKAYVDDSASSSLANRIWVDKSGNDSTAVIGDIKYPCLTVQKAADLISTASSNADFNDATKRSYIVHVGPGIYVESVIFGTRPVLLLDLNAGALIQGNVTVQFDQGTISGAGLQSPSFTVTGPNARSLAGGAATIGIQGDLINESINTGSSLVSLMHVRGVGITGKITKKKTGAAGGYTLTLFIEGSIVQGVIEETTGNSGLTLYADNCNDSSSNSLGAISGNVNLNVINDVRFNGTVVTTSSSHGRWFNVEFKSATAHNFTGFVGTASADANSYESFQANVPTKGSGTFTLLDSARGIRNTPSGNLSSTDVQSALNELQTDINALASYTQTFNSTTDWTGPSLGLYSLTIPFATHAHNNPMIQVFETNVAVFDIVYPGVTVDSSFNLVLTVTSTPDLRFAGKLIIS